MQSITITQATNTLTINGGETTILTDDAGNPRATAWLLGYDGLGMPPAHRITDRAPNQHGVTDQGYRLDPRTFMLAFGFRSVRDTTAYTNDAGTIDVDTWRTDSGGDEEDTRDLFLSLFRPRIDPLTLTFTRYNGSVRQIAAHCVSGLTFGQVAREGMQYKTAEAKLYAPDPLLYDPTLNTLIFGIGSGASGFAVPVAIPIAVGASSGIAQTKTLLYGGTEREYPVVRITGPITNPVVTNVATTDKLDFTGTTITAGHYYEVDCRYGVKTVTDDAGADQIAKLSTDSDLGTFSLEADPDVPGGANDITVSGTSTTNATSIYVTWYTRYVGM